MVLEGAVRIRRGLFALLASLVVGLAGACGGTEATHDTSSDAGTSDGATDPDAGADAQLAYPPGPYGGGIGDVLPDFTIQGYAMSPQARDSSQLPWREIHLSEARSPSCTCMIVVLGVVGLQCQPALLEDQLLASAVANDPSLCVLVAIGANFDGENPTDGPPWVVSPPTRSDVDTFTQSNREDFPIGIVTESSRQALSAKNAPFDPLNFIVRPSDMRILAMTAGIGTPLVQTAKGMCAHPPPSVETLSAGVTPRKIVDDDGELYFTDDERGVLHVSTAGGATTVVTATNGPADALAVDATSVYWATHDGNAPYTIGRAPKTGGASTVIASSDAGFRSIAVDADNVYFARDDGVVGSVPLGGGSVTTLVSGESQLGSLVLDDTTVFFVTGANGEVASVPKSSGARTSLLSPSMPTNVWSGATGALRVSGNGLVAAAQGQIFPFPKGGTQWPPLAADPGLMRASALAVRNNGDAVVGVGDPLLGPGLIALDHARGLSLITAGQDGLYDLTADQLYTYWTVRGDGTARNGSVRRILR